MRRAQSGTIPHHLTHRHAPLCRTKAQRLRLSFPSLVCGATSPCSVRLSETGSPPADVHIASGGSVARRHAFAPHTLHPAIASSVRTPTIRSTLHHAAPQNKTQNHSKADQATPHRITPSHARPRYTATSHHTTPKHPTPLQPTTYYAPPNLTATHLDTPAMPCPPHSVPPQPVLPCPTSPQAA